MHLKSYILTALQVLVVLCGVWGGCVARQVFIRLSFFETHSHLPRHTTSLTTELRSVRGGSLPEPHQSRGASLHGRASLCRGWGTKVPSTLLLHLHFRAS